MPANTEPDLAGYRVVWRVTTADQWQGAQDVGNVTQARLALSKDKLLLWRAGDRPRRQRQRGNLPDAATLIN